MFLYVYLYFQVQRYNLENLLFW